MLMRVCFDISQCKLIATIILSLMPVALQYNIKGLMHQKSSIHSISALRTRF